MSHAPLNKCQAICLNFPNPDLSDFQQFPILLRLAQFKPKRVNR